MPAVNPAPALGVFQSPINQATAHAPKSTGKRAPARQLTIAAAATRAPAATSAVSAAAESPVTARFGALLTIAIVAAAASAKIKTRPSRGQIRLSPLTGQPARRAAIPRQRS